MVGPPLPSIITPALLTSLRQHPSLPRDTWYLVAATALSALNRPDEIPKVYTSALDHVDGGEAGGEGGRGGGGGDGDARSRGEHLQLQTARRMREALIKASAVGGLPKWVGMRVAVGVVHAFQAINSLLALKAASPPHLLDEPGAESPTRRPHEAVHTPPAEILARGQEYFGRVYGKVAGRVMSQMDRSGTEDLGLTARLMYGHLLSNTSILSQAETSMVLIAALIPQDVNPQLKGHLKGALNSGATVEEVRAVRQVVIEICEASGMRRLEAAAPGGWGWRTDVASV